MAFVLVGLYELFAAIEVAETAVAVEEAAAFAAESFAEASASAGETLLAEESVPLIEGRAGQLIDAAMDFTKFGAPKPTSLVGVLPEAGVKFGSVVAPSIVEGLSAPPSDKINDLNNEAIDITEGTINVEEEVKVEPGDPLAAEEGTFPEGSEAEYIAEILNGFAQDPAKNLKYFGSSEPISIGYLINTLQAEIPAEAVGEMILFADGKSMSARHLGRDVGLFMNYSSKVPEGGNSTLSMFETAKSHPELAYLLQPIYDFEEAKRAKGELPITKAEIFRIYDGKGIHPRNVITNKLTGKFGIRDETGVFQEYLGKQGILPAFDTWVGPLSPNNTAPTTIFGTIALLHDIDYSRRGWFDWEGDQKFISRISHLLPYMSPVEQVLAKQARTYFSTIGYSLALFKGALGSNPDKEEYIQAGGDLFYKLTNSDDPVLRKKFYESMREGLESTLFESMSMNNISTQINYAYIIDAFDNITVERP